MAADPPLYGSDQSRFARYLERREARSPDLVARELRRRLLAGLRGRVLELGCGDGRAFEQYPPAVTGVLAVEPDPTARAVAAERAQEAPVPIEVVEGDASALPAQDGAFLRGEKTVVLLIRAVDAVPGVSGLAVAVANAVEPVEDAAVMRGMDLGVVRQSVRDDPIALRRIQVVEDLVGPDPTRRG